MHHVRAQATCAGHRPQRQAGGADQPQLLAIHQAHRGHRAAADVASQVGQFVEGGVAARRQVQPVDGRLPRRLVRPQRRQPALQQRQHLLGLRALVEEAGNAVLGAGAPHVLVIAVAQHDRARADAQLPDRPQHPQPAAGLQRQVHHHHVGLGPGDRLDRGGLASRLAHHLDPAFSRQQRLQLRPDGDGPFDDDDVHDRCSLFHSVSSDVACRRSRRPPAPLCVESRSACQPFLTRLPPGAVGRERRHEIGGRRWVKGR